MMNITIQDLGAIGEFVGALAVLVTLVYLAVQTRQTARGAAAQGPQWISDGYRNWFQSVRADPEFTRLVRISMHDWEALSLNDQTRVHALHAELIVHLDAVLRLSDQGFYDDAAASPLCQGSCRL